MTAAKLPRRSRCGAASRRGGATCQGFSRLLIRPADRARRAAKQATRCLFSDEVLASPTAALQRASDAFGFDFARLRQVCQAAACAGASRRADADCVAPHAVSRSSSWTSTAASSSSTSCANRCGRFSARFATSHRCRSRFNRAPARCRLRRRALKMQLHWTTRTLGSRYAIASSAAPR